MKRYLTLSIFLLIASLSFAQAIKGTVTDATTHEALPNVMITSADSSSSSHKDLARTNASGKFEINVQGISRIRFSMIGYTAKIIILDNSPGDLNIALEQSSVDLQPVIVTASREKQARKEAPIAITQINSTQIKD